MVKLDDSLKIDIVDEVKPAGGSDLEAGDIPFDSDDDTIPEKLIPSFSAKPPPTDEIFDEGEAPAVKEEVSEKPPPQVKVVSEPEVIAEPTQPKEKPVKLTKKGRPRKPMSAEHKAKLAQSREKAMAKKKYLAEQRAITKSQEKEIKEKEFKISQAKNKKRLDELNSQMPTEPAPAPRSPTPKPTREEVDKKMSSNITMKDLEEMSMKTLITMESMRKKRKEAKKKAQQESKYQQEVMETIKQANPSWIVEGSPFNNCF
tara:strand:+ start:3631 stop:4407 length:777 start_codon:yes stop_codon:yes gene_type:complete